MSSADDDATAQAGGGAFRRRPSTGRLLRFARAAFVVVVALALVATIVREGPEVRAALGRLAPTTIALSFVLACLAQVALWQSWHALLRGTGPSPGRRASAYVFFVGQLGKYVPGGIWTILAQADLGAARRMTRVRGAVVSVVSLVVLAVTGTGVGLVATRTSSRGIVTYGWTVLVLVAGVVALTPRPLAALTRLAFRLTSTTTEGFAFGGRSVVSSAVWSVAWWVLIGLHGWVIARDLSAGAPPVTVVGAFALAWVVGLVVVVAPAGVGAREGALVLLLAGTMGTGDALVLALLSRAVLVVVDLISAAATLGGRSRRRPVPGEST